MADQEQPEEADKTIYQRDKTAKDPKPLADSKQAPAKPKVKPRKVFVAKKFAPKADQGMEHRVRHILLSSMDAAKVIHESIAELQKELAEQPVDDPDKEFHDREKVEKFFSRLAKKYSACTTRLLGGDLEWVYRGMKVPEEIMTPDLIEAIVNAERYSLLEPLKTRLGCHIVLLCESQVHTPKKQAKTQPSKAKPPPSGIPG